MAFCTRCGRQTEGGQRTADGAELCLYCGELAAGPEVHHGYPGQRSSRHGGPGDLYSRQDGPGGGYSRPASSGQSESSEDYPAERSAASPCRVPLSDYPSLTDLPAVAVAWPTTSYSSRFRTGRHALPPELAPRRYAPVAAQLRVRPGPPELEDGHPLPARQAELDARTEAQDRAGADSDADRADDLRPEGRSAPEDQPGREDQPGQEDQPGRARQAAVAGAHRALTLVRGNRWLTAASAGLVLVVGATTVAVALGDRDPQTQRPGAADGSNHGASDTGQRTSTTQREDDGTQPGGLVRAAVPAAAGAHEARVLSLLDRYFAAINGHDFAAYRRLFSPALRGRLSAAAFLADYGTATDSDATLHSITVVNPGRLAVLVTYSSHSQPAASSATSLCADWTTWLYLARHGHRYVLVNAPAGHQPSGRSCG